MSLGNKKVDIKFSLILGFDLWLSPLKREHF